MLVLQAISGPDPGDVSSAPCHLEFDATAPVDTLIGRLFDEGTVARAGIAFERAFGGLGERPPEFSAGL